MSRKRKPTRKPLAAAAECLYWRAIVLLEMVSALKVPATIDEPIKRLQAALDDFEASREGDLLTLYVCAACQGPCSERRNGLCNRCFDAQVPISGQGSLLAFAEMQS